MKVILTKPERQILGFADAWPQCATYPQSPFSEPVRCCDVANLYQAFSQPTGPGRLWISLDALLLQYQIDPLINQTNPTQSRSKQPKTVT
jgi:hypothetical protein